MTWKRACLILSIACLWLAYRNCTRPRAAKSQPPSVSECERVLSADETITIVRREDGASSSASGDQPALAPSGGGLSLHGFHVPAWALRLAPQPGENLIAYRDRMLPLAQAALAPHRSRVARGRDDFAAAVGLDTQQRAELDAAVQEAATQIQERVLEAAFNGELSPQSFKPMTGVKLARDLLDTVDRANLRFLATLREDQRGKLTRHPFDIADYLLFNTRWEEALGVPSR